MRRLDRHGLVSVLDADPDLGELIPRGEFAGARLRAVARAVRVDQGVWDPGELAAGASVNWLGVLVLDGVMLRRVRAGGGRACEVLGSGDLLRPWDNDGDYEPLPITVDWRLLTPARCAILDDRFAAGIAPWPQLTSRLLARASSRARRLAAQHAITHLPRAHANVLVAFWLLAERWGTAGLDGVTVRLPLTHQILSAIVGSHRPSVTIAIGRLAREGLLVRQARDQWLLTNRAIGLLDTPDAFAAPERRRPGSPPLAA